jgi:hypothetical protein
MAYNSAQTTNFAPAGETKQSHHQRNGVVEIVAPKGQDVHQRARIWCVVQNNWTQHQVREWENAKCAAKIVTPKVGERSGTPYLQGAICFKDAKSWLTVMKIFSEAFVAPFHEHSSWKELRHHSFKPGCEDALVDEGEGPVNQGKRVDLDTCRDNDGVVSGMMTKPKRGVNPNPNVTNRPPKIANRNATVAVAGKTPRQSHKTPKGAARITIPLGVDPSRLARIWCIVQNNWTDKQREEWTLPCRAKIVTAEDDETPGSQHLTGAICFENRKSWLQVNKLFSNALVTPMPKDSSWAELRYDRLKPGCKEPLFDNGVGPAKQGKRGHVDIERFRDDIKAGFTDAQLWHAHAAGCAHFPNFINVVRKVFKMN